MTLTTRQVEAVRQGEAVDVTVAGLEGVGCVLVRKDVYDRLTRLVDDDADFDPVDAYPLIDEMMADDDANDPWLESYQTP